jgi:hypothetical protein
MKYVNNEYDVCAVNVFDFRKRVSRHQGGNSRSSGIDRCPRCRGTLNRNVLDLLCTAAQPNRLKQVSPSGAKVNHSQSSLPGEIGNPSVNPHTKLLKLRIAWLALDTLRIDRALE